METRVFRVLDRGTSCGVMVTKVTTTDSLCNQSLRDAGYSKSDYFLYTPLEGQGKGTISDDPYKWGDRTHQNAHYYIQYHWGDITNNSVIDIVKILKAQEDEEIRLEKLRISLIENPEFTEELRAEFLSWASRNNFDIKYDIGFYSAREWAARGESCGIDCLASFTFEGKLREIISGNYTPSDDELAQFSPKIPDQLTELFDKYDLEWKLGHSWSGHLYKRSE